MPVLTWLTRENDLKLAQNAPYRLLEEVPEFSAGDSATENMLIQGDTSVVWVNCQCRLTLKTQKKPACESASKIDPLRLQA